MAEVLNLLPHLGSFGRKAVGSGGISHSRSTSAGSSLSDGHGSADLHKPLGYPTDTLELPQYDYPTPWSVERFTQLPESDYAAPLIVKNTFIGTNVVRPLSLQEFYEERQTQSCPASGIGLPPGLEELLEPEDAAAKLVEAEQSWLKTPPPSWLEASASCEVPWATDHLLPAGLLDLPMDLQPWQFLPVPPQQPPVLDVRCLSQFSPAPPHAPRQALVLDLQAALGSTFNAPEQQWVPDQPTERQLGSPECPTVGSQGHWFGACKPCAFLYTKGCANGALCTFCHLCDSDEKKRRAKDKRAGLRSLRQRGC
jgi:hypothetical protein